MAVKHPKTRLTSREYKDGRGWYVEAKSNDGSPENIGDFASDFEAREWIIQQSAIYFKARLK